MSDAEETRKKFVQFIIKNQRIRDNSKYGEFIIQTNEVQLWLSFIILIRTTHRTKQLKNNLENAEFGKLIGYFLVCLKTTDLNLLKTLNTYKTDRNALAHKMFTNKKLTVKQCEKAIELGNELLKLLKNMVNLELKEIELAILRAKMNTTSDRKLPS